MFWCGFFQNAVFVITCFKNMFTLSPLSILTIRIYKTTIFLTLNLKTLALYQSGRGKLSFYSQGLHGKVKTSSPLPSVADYFVC